MSDHINLSIEEIKHRVMQLHQLTAEKRGEVEQILVSLRQFGIGREELHKQLWKLQERGALSEYDVQLVEKAVFG